MTAKNQTKTSKTAHVMNLLNKGRQDHTGAEGGAPESGVEQEGRTLTLSDTADADSAMAEQIKNALEEDWKASSDQPEPPPEQPPQEEAPREEAPREAEVEAPPAQPVKEAPPAPAEEPRQPVETAEAQPPESSIEYVNVMQILVEEKAKRYIKMFELCQCARCMVDVKALALCNLPAKYVVMGKGEMVPRITIYESRYNTAVTAQIMRACKIVLENPRHNL